MADAAERSLLEGTPTPGVRWWTVADFANRCRSFAPPISGEILTLPEVAQLLKIANRTVCTMAQKVELLALEGGGRLRFRRTDLDVWIDTKTGAPTTRRRSDQPSDVRVALGLLQRCGLGPSRAGRA
jgi:excisionase family DNA binding protein